MIPEELKEAVERRGNLTAVIGILILILALILAFLSG